MTRFPAERPLAGAAFYEAHGLGNDYLVVEEGSAWRADEASVGAVCDRWRGVGGDGIVVVLRPAEEPFRLRMFNPDGSEFERSGNGLRVAASWLHRTGRVGTGRPFEVEVGGDRVVMTVHGREPGGPWDVSVEMGRARVGAAAVDADPSALDPHGRLALADGGSVPVNLVGVGNPHCVVFVDEDVQGRAFGRELLDRLGPALTGHPAFAHGTNVQLARVAVEGGGAGGPAGRGGPSGGAPGRAGGGGVVEALIWERGVGHTTASGTSSCAVAVAAVESGRLAPGPVEVRMEGGSLFVDVSETFEVTLRGPVEEIMTGEIAPGLLGRLTAP